MTSREHTEVDLDPGELTPAGDLITAPRPAITLLPGELFVTLDSEGRERHWVVAGTGLVKITTTTHGVTS